ncbi:hypothetical protein [Halorarum salinum]|uniref:Uncharacterized protein n=1 Tax=Halorarum salinum TaxID=2743089 RepID=A0A7D5L8J3_9EURY|nr:hypothetical protein [Halobaculum salinum]QLG60846.1 hypothetical protein HUG12_03425 [Halobaculum salinum]
MGRDIRLPDVLHVPYASPARGLFDRDTDVSDEEPSDDADRFEPVAGTAPAEGSEDDGEADANDEPRLAPVRLRDDDFSGTLKRAVDQEAGVVLYAYENGNGGGLAAVPLAETELPTGSDRRPRRAYRVPFTGAGTASRTPGTPGSRCRVR